MEKWVRVEDTNYEISNYGRMVNTKTGNLLKTQANKKGYQVIRVTINRVKRTFRIHRLVAQYFVFNPDNKTQVNHIDGNKNNNRYDNLEWCSNAENAHHAIKTGLWESVIEGSRLENEKRKKKIIAKNIYTNEVLHFDSISDAERQIGTRHIVDVIKGKRKQAKGYEFEYAD